MGQVPYCYEAHEQQVLMKPHKHEKKLDSKQSSLTGHAS